VFSFFSFSHVFLFIGASSDVYKKSYFFFEKLRVLRGEPKTVQRITAEKAVPVAVVSRETSEGKNSTESNSHKQTRGRTIVNTTSSSSSKSSSNIPKEVTKEKEQYDEDDDEVEIIDDDSEEEEEEEDENDLGDSQEPDKEEKEGATPSKPKETRKRRRSTPKITYPKKGNKRVKTSPSNKEPNDEDEEDSVVAPMKFEPGASIAQVANQYRSKATQEAKDRYIWRFVQREFTEGTFIGVIAEFCYPFFTVNEHFFTLNCCFDYFQ
jgi:hypothetical protein